MHCNIVVIGVIERIKPIKKYFIQFFSFLHIRLAIITIMTDFRHIVPIDITMVNFVHIN